MLRILCWLGLHDWEEFKDALSWTPPHNPDPYKMCWRCEKQESIKKVAMVKIRKCEQCGKDYTVIQNKQKFCKLACRVKAYQIRKFGSYEAYYEKYHKANRYHLYKQYR